jgi:ABC-type polysaccharide/polyol phosphate export permease
MLNVGTMFLFWVTPIFYPLDMIPHGYRWLLVANPASCYVILYRSLLYDCAPGASHMWLLASGFAVVSIVAGYALFINNESEIVKRI